MTQDSAIESLSNEERALAVRSMFGAIASGYDRTNSVLSGGIHHLWRRTAVRLLRAAPDAEVLDCCCGTGDLSFAIAKSLGAGGRVVGTDFTPEMVELAQAKATLRGDGAPTFEVADAMSLPFDDDSFDAATVSFGIRNVVDPVAGLRDMARCVRPGGRVLVLEFGQPDGLVMGPLFRFYSRWLMPRIGGLLTGNREAYEYLPRTSAAFPAGAEFVSQVLEKAGLELEVARPMTRGIAWIYVGVVR
jgi:demethylmenaquinone methyltransferase / 2-methoxy-6-polyprenyl-1,4-benzoquinol methylase